MKKTNLLFLIVLLLVSCRIEPTDVNLAEENIPFLTITVNNNTILNDNRLFYTVKGEGGIDLASGEVFNGDNIVLQDNSYQGETIAISIFKYVSSQDRVVANSYLNVPLNRLLVLSAENNAFPQTSADLAFNNLSNDSGEIRISTPGFFTLANADFIQDDQIFSFSFDEEAPFTFVTSTPMDTPPQYQILALDTESTHIIDLQNNINMENENIVTADVASLGTFEYSASVGGISPMNTSETYSLYVTDLEISSNELSVFTPEVFEEFDTTLQARNTNLIYGQNTVGIIPSTFGFIDPEITINEVSLSNVNITASGNNTSYINGSWRVENSNQFTWDVNFPSTNVIAYNINEIPEAILVELPTLNQINNLSLVQVSAINIDNLGFSDALNRLLLQTDLNFNQVSATMTRFKTIRQ